MIFVVAEIGVNWDGNFDLVKEMIKEAKKAGCQAIKFQAFLKEQIKDHPEKSRLIKSTINTENVQPINEIAKSVGLEWFCTPMYPEAVSMLDPYVKRFKIREIDGRLLLENKTSELIDKILETKKEIIVSSQKSPHNCKYYENSNISWLYCVPKYPCNLNELDFSNFKNFDGYSNHCQQIIAPIASAILGAKIIEIHITSNKSKNFVDNNVSFDYDELQELVNHVRLSEKIKYE